MTNSPPLLSIQDLHVTFTTTSGPLDVVQGVALELRPGEALALVGESGSGKSVTAQAIIQLLSSSGKITCGRIWFDGEELSTKSKKEMQQIRGKKIGMIFQDPMTSLNPTMRIGRQIAESLVFHEKISYRKAQKQVLELLKRVGIADPELRSAAYPFQLSGGMRQRVLIAMALVCKPLLLIADEPTTALDVTIQAQILELLHEIRQETKMSLLLITHDLGVVAGVCDRAAVMQKGKIVETANVETLFSSPQHPYTRALLAAKRGGSCG